MLQATKVFSKNWAAIHEMAFNPDGSPKLDINGNHERRYKYIINEGSSRSSKTVSLIDCYDLYARANEHKRMTVWRDTKTDCKKTVLNDTIKHLKKTNRYLWNQFFNKTESIFTYSSGSTFEIHGTDDEETVFGLTQDVAWLNEPYKISKEIFDQIDQRTSDFVFIDWNPKKAHWIEDLKKDSRALVIHSTFRDNPFCPPEQRNKILSYQTVKYSKVVQAQKITEGAALNYNSSENELGFTENELNELTRCQENEYKRSASEFNWLVYGLGLKAEKPNRIFHWEEITPYEYEQLNVKTYNGCDWGAVDPWAILEAKYYDGGLYLRELNYNSENVVRSQLSQQELSLIKESDEGIVSWMFNKIGVSKSNIIICDNNRHEKIKALRRAGWDYAIAAGKGPGSKIDGIDVLNNIRVYYTTDSVNLKYEHENYSRKVDKYGSVLEEPQEEDDHTMDVSRYIALFLQSEGIIKTV